jgi:hypothetical protein
MDTRHALGTQASRISYGRREGGQRGQAILVANVCYLPAADLAVDLYRMSVSDANNLLRVAFIKDESYVSEQ